MTVQNTQASGREVSVAIREREPGEKRYKWTVQFEVDAVWVADGFDLDDDRALAMLAADLSYANIGTELGAKVVKAPDPKAIRKEQGYCE
jgi:hypothetical protein